MQPYQVEVAGGANWLGLAGFAALLLGHRLAGNDNAQSVARAAAGISHVIANSIGQAELALSSSLAGAVSALPAAAEPVA